MKWVESKQQNSTSLPKAAFPAGRPPWAFPRQVPAGRPRWDLCRSNPGPPARGSPVLRALRMGSSEAALGRSAPLPARPRAGARCGTAYPSGGPGSYEASGRSAPGAPPTRRGSPFLPRNGEKEGRGPLSSVGSSVGTIAGWTLQRGFPADSGGGARLSLEKVGGKNTRAPPWTRVFMAARSHSLVFGIVVSDTIEGLFRSGF